MNNSEAYVKTFIPGFLMGATRALISHPFEILKIKSQLNVKKDIPLFKGLHYSLIATGIERGLQFGLYDLFKTNNDSNLVSSFKASILSTFVGIPYNFYIVNKSIMNQKCSFYLFNLSKTIPLEYSRSYLGSTLFLYTYHELKEYDISPWLSAFGGTSCVWFFTYPIDNIRNQIISKNMNFQVKNLYKGIQYPIIRSIPSSIVGMYVYETVKNMM